MKCINCQTENKDSAKFCKGCGSPITAAAQQPDVQSKPCPDCQSDCKPEAKFCPKCGHKFSAAAVEVSASPAEKHAATNPQVTPVIDVAMPQETKTCPNCNNALKLTAMFCGKCGFSFEQMSAPQIKQSNVVSDVPPPLEQSNPAAPPIEAIAAEGTMPCPSCSNLLKLTAKFCGKCGFSFEEKVPHRTEELHPVPETSQTTEAQPSVENIDSQAEVAPSQPEIRTPPAETPPSAQAANTAQKPSYVPIISVIVLLVSAIGGGAYWWLKAKGETKPEAPLAQAQQVAPAASAPIAASKPAIPAAAPAEVAPKAPPAQTKQAAAPTAKAAPTVPANPTRSNAPTVRKEQTPASSRTSPTPPAPDIKLDSQSETMLSMGERMFANKQYSAALDLSKQVLRKHSGNPRATRLKDSCLAEIERQKNELTGQVNGLFK